MIRKCKQNLDEEVLDSFIARHIRSRLSRVDFFWIVSIALIIVLFFTLLTIYFFPIYPDEIQARLWLSRLPYDFPVKISGSPICVSSYFQSIPITFYIPSIINWIFHGQLESVVTLRIIGFLILILWLIPFVWYVAHKIKVEAALEDVIVIKNRLIFYIIGCFISFFSVGVLPFFLITNRGEQLIFPSVVLLIGIFIISRKDSSASFFKTALLVSLYFLGVSLIIYGHPKGMFLTPFFLVVLWQIFAKCRSRVPFLLALTLLFFHISQNLYALKLAFQCSEVPAFELLLKSFSLDPLSIFYDPKSFLRGALDSIAHSYKYLLKLVFRSHTDISYLPLKKVNLFGHIANVLIILDYIGILLILSILMPLKYYKKDILSDRFITTNLMLIVLFLSVLISAIFNLPKNWYDAGYIYTLLSITLIFFLVENFSSLWLSINARRLFIYLGVIALLSQLVLIHRYLPAFLDGFAGPSISIVKYNESKTQADLKEASRICEINPVNSKKIIVDDLSYLYFHRSKWPLPVTYIFFMGEDKKMLSHFFSHLDSDGLVARCSSLSPEINIYTKKTGDICCVSKSDVLKFYN